MVVVCSARDVDTYGWDILSGEGVGRVGDQHAALADGAVAYNHQLDRLHCVMVAAKSVVAEDAALISVADDDDALISVAVEDDALISVVVGDDASISVVADDDALISVVAEDDAASISVIDAVGWEVRDERGSERKSDQVIEHRWCISYNRTPSQ